MQNNDINPVVSIIFVVIFIFGMTGFFYWLNTTKFGRRSLVNIRPRRVYFPTYLPLLLVVTWYLYRYLAASLFMESGSNGPEVGSELGVAAADLTVNTLFACFILILANFGFAGGLKTFGIISDNFMKKFFKGLIGIMIIWPLMISALYITLFTGKLFYGMDFEIERHQSLDIISNNASIYLKIVLFVSTSLIGPFFEELLFRGIIQSSFRAAGFAVWPAIGITSAIFAILHNPQHFLPIFILSCGIGYVYEKNSSLWPSIIMHMIFNGVTVTMVLLLS